MDLMENCTLCPRKCGVNRKKGEVGFCGCDDKIKTARESLHYWEEPCISGENGSGTVFFSHCSLRCVYCQNHKISAGGMGKEVSEKELSQIFLRLQADGANNINLVTPTHYVTGIIEAVRLAKNDGLIIPIIYNTSGYENPETIGMLDGIVDVFLPDFKYFDSTYAERYSKARNYFDIASLALKKMVELVGECVFDENGIIRKGVIVRHLMLPGLFSDSKKIIKYLYSEYGNKIFISIMNQYTPLQTLPDNFPELNKKISARAYDALIDYALSIGVENAYIQEGDTAKESFIPEFHG